MALRLLSRRATRAHAGQQPRKRLAICKQGRARSDLRRFLVVATDVRLLGVATLSLKGVRRFLKVWGQTILAPVITTLVLLAVFALALGNLQRTIAGLPFLVFLAPGLIMMAVAENAFANTSSSP